MTITTSDARRMTMTDADLLTLAGREVERLSDQNDHCAAAIMRALMERVRGVAVSVVMVDGQLAPEDVRRFRWAGASQSGDLDVVSRHHLPAVVVQPGTPRL